MIGIFLLKCIIAAAVPLYADETYYAIWSLFPRLSYFDHPAMVSWLIFISTKIIPFHNPISVRLVFIILSTCTALTWLLILQKKKVDPSIWIYFLILFNLNPLIGVGSIIATPDVPLVFFWSLSYLLYLNVLESPSLKWCFLLGCTLGLGFCSKYHIVLFVLAAIIQLFIQKPTQKIRINGVLLTILGGLIFSMPVLIWNYENNWVSFLFQIKHGFGRANYKTEWTYSYLVGQFLILSPLVAINLFKFKKKSADQVFSLSQLLFFITSTFKSVVEANWPIVAQPHALSHFVQTAERKKFIWSMTYWLIVYFAFFVFLLTPKGASVFSNQLSTSRIKDLVPIAQKYQPLFGPTYQISSLLSWESQIFVPKLRGFSRKDFYNDLSASVPPKNKTFYVLKEFGSGWPDELTNIQFKKLEVFDALQLELFQVTYE